MSIDNKIYDSAWKQSAVAMALFISTKGSTAVTPEIEIKGNQP